MALTYRDLVSEFKMSRSGDAWGDTINWLFHIADSLTFHHDVPVPAEWSFSPSPLGRADDPEESFEAAACDQADPDELLKFGAVLWRVRERLLSLGRDY